MSIQISITGDNFASIIGDMQDFIDGGRLDISGADFETSEDTPTPAPAKPRRGRKPRAAAPAQQDAKADITPAPPAPAAAAPNAAAPAPDAGTTTAPVAAAPTLGPDAVAPGGAVFNAVKAFNDKYGMEKAREVLLTFGAGMVRQIKPEQYTAALKAFAV